MALPIVQVLQALLAQTPQVQNHATWWQPAKKNQQSLALVGRCKSWTSHLSGNIWTPNWWSQQDHKHLFLVIQDTMDRYSMAHCGGMFGTPQLPYPVVSSSFEFVSQLVHGEPLWLRSFCKALLKASSTECTPLVLHGCKGSSNPIQLLVLISLYRNLTLNQHRKGSAAATK